MPGHAKATFLNQAMLSSLISRAKALIADEQAADIVERYTLNTKVDEP